MDTLRRPRRSVRRGRVGVAPPALAGDGGFTLVEVSMAAILVVAFALAVAASFGTAFGVARGNILRQQATSAVNQELEYARTLTWPQLAMASVEETAPMLGDGRSTVLGSEAGFDGAETIVVMPDDGLVTPYRSYVIDGTRYDAWRYVTHAPGGFRRFTVLVTWSNEATSESLLGSTLISEVTARSNRGAATTTPDGATVPTTSTTTTSTTTTSSSTTTTSTTTTTTMALPHLIVERVVLSLDESGSQQVAEVRVEFESGVNAGGVVVTGRWSTTPEEAGYPFEVNQITSPNGIAVFTHNDGHPEDTGVQFCVTDLTLAGYRYTGGIQCATGVWG